MMVVELLTLQPVRMHYDIRPEANDKVFCEQVIKDLPVGRKWCMKYTDDGGALKMPLI